MTLNKRLPCLRLVCKNNPVVMSVDPIPDQQAEVRLLLEIGQGNRRSFEMLYQRFSGILFTTALRILNDKAEAEDVIQEVFFQIWEKAAVYTPHRGKPLSWALTLTRNKAIDRLRAIQRRGRLNDEVERETDGQMQIEVRDSTHEMDAVQKGKIIRSAVMQLSRDQRQAIEMAFFAGLTQNQIATQLQQPLGTVKARIRRGMLRLKNLIEAKL